ncbi:MAG: hypothetical protein PVH62_10410 [Anaerolineae bacterium]|jgi:hypothetical protein
MRILPGRIGFILCLVALMLATAWMPAPQQEEVVVTGQVTNGTPGGSVPTGLQVMLHLFSETEGTETHTTTLAGDGSFRFDDLSPEGNETFTARVIYEGVSYSSEPTTLEAGERELSLPVTIYETTEDPAAVEVSQLHIFVSGVGSRLQFGEYYLVSNVGDRTYIGVEDPETGRRATLTFTLPEGAESLSFDGPGQGERYLEREVGFADTEPVPPGNATVEILFQYQLSYREGLRVERVLDVPVSSAVLVIPEEVGLALEGPRVIPAGSLETRLGPALSYTAGPLEAGEPLVFTLVARQSESERSLAPQTSSRTRNMAREVGVGLAALAAALVGVYFLWRPAPAGPVPARTRPLVEAVASLDDEFESGKISEKAYRKKRKSLKRRLRALLRAAEEQAEGGEGTKGSG